MWIEGSICQTNMLIYQGCFVCMFNSIYLLIPTDLQIIKFNLYDIVISSNTDLMAYWCWTEVLISLNQTKSRWHFSNVITLSFIFTVKRNEEWYEKCLSCLTNHTTDKIDELLNVLPQSFFSQELKIMYNINYIYIFFFKTPILCFKWLKERIP